MCQSIRVMADSGLTLEQLWQVYLVEVALVVSPNHYRELLTQHCAIAIETGNFEVDASEITACDRLEARHPNTQFGLSALVPATFVDLANVIGGLYGWRSGQCGI